MRSPLPNKVVDFFICISQGDILSLYCGKMRTDEDDWRCKFYLFILTIMFIFAYNK